MNVKQFPLRIFSILMVLAFAFTPVAQARSVQAATSDLFFSEYIEGSSNNKALEIYNGTGAAVDLAAGGYQVQMFFNGSSSAGLTINLTGTVADGDVFVVAQSSADSAILAEADLTNGAGWFNGDDAVVLAKGGTVIDVIGQIGFDPGSEWGSGLTSTADNTLRRKVDICAGDPDGSDAFDPAVQWDGYATNTFDGLGSHTASCGGSTGPAEPVINEFSASTTSTDVEYVEIFGDANTDYSAYTVLEIEGDFSGTNTGTVDEVISLGTTDANRLYLASLPAGALENGTISLLLVKNFTGALGDDLDTNDDGTFDATPWDAVVDAVAVNDGGASDRDLWHACSRRFITMGFAIFSRRRFSLPGRQGYRCRMPTGSATILTWPVSLGLPEHYFRRGCVTLPASRMKSMLPRRKPAAIPSRLFMKCRERHSQPVGRAMNVAIEGVVVGDFQNNASPDNGDLNGFNVQDPTGDGNPATSDGVFVYAPSAMDVENGDTVRVRGSVSNTTA